MLSYVKKPLHSGMFWSFFAHIAIVVVILFTYVFNHFAKPPIDIMTVEVIEDSNLFEDKSLGESRLKKVNDQPEEKLPLVLPKKEELKTQEVVEQHKPEVKKVNDDIVNSVLPTKKPQVEKKDTDQKNDNLNEIKNIVIKAKSKNLRQSEKNIAHGKIEQDGDVKKKSEKVISGKNIDTVDNKDKVGNSGLAESGVAKDYVQDNNITKILSSVRRCWNKYYSYSESTKDIVITMVVKFDRSGALLSYSEQSNSNLVDVNEVLAYNYMLEVATDSLKECTPIDGLDPSKYYMWSDVIINFKYDNSDAIILR